MTNVLIRTESHFTVDRKSIRRAVEGVLCEKGVRGNAEISVSIVGDRLMKNLNKKYRNLDETTDVLSFPLAGDAHSPFVGPPDGILYLGDIVVSYPQARDEAAEENKKLEEKINELVIHGLLHLLGQHHD